MDLSLVSSHLQDYSKWLQQSQDDNDGHFRNFSLSGITGIVSTVAVRLVLVLIGR